MTSHQDLIEELRREILEKQQALDASPAAPGLIPLKIQCVMASCRNGHHSLDYTRRDRTGLVTPGCCRDCGVRVTELPELDGRDYEDETQLVHIAKSQQSELIRAHYWTVPIDKRAYNQALRLGMRALRDRVDKVVRRNLLDIEFGRQKASYSGDIIAYAQHATATCCRQCAVYWHGFPAAGEPTEKQLRFAVRFATSYLEARLEAIPEEPSATPVPPVRRADHVNGSLARSIEIGLGASLVQEGDPAGLLMPSETKLKTVHARHPDGAGYIRVVHPDDGTLFDLR